MTDDKIKALEGRIAALEDEVKARDVELRAVTQALIETISMLVLHDPKRKQLAERLRTFGDRPGMAAEPARHLMDAIADRIETAG